MSLQRKLQLLIASVFFFSLAIGAFIIFYLPQLELTPTDELFLTFGVGMLSLLSLAGAASAFYILHIIIEPLENLSQRLSSGDTDVPVELQVIDNEIGTIARAFAEVYENAEDKYKALQNKVERRTRAMEESKAKDEAIIKNIAEGLVVTDMERKVVFVNPVGERMLGYRLFELFEKTWPDFLHVKDKHEQDVPLDDLAITKALQEGKTTKAAIANHSYIVRKNGSTVPVLISAAPINVGEKQLGAVIVFRDVSKEVEVDKTKTEFVSLASHQLRTPLSTINWYVETILSGDVGNLQDDQRPYFEQIYESTQRMIDLVNALLNVSRLEMGTFMVEPETMNLHKLLDNVLAELEPRINSKEITLEKDIDSDIAPLLLDEQLTWIILQNLLTNAVKYTPEKGTVRIVAKKHSAGEVIAKTELDNDSIVVSVKDSGYGIPSYQQDQIFSKLFRADNVRERDTEGTGLGLYIVKSILDHVGGQAWFESIENEGSTFYVAIPAEGMKKREGTKALSAGAYN